MHHLHLDESFVCRLASDLELFQQTGPRLWTFRCPYCGDSKKSQRKKRGNIFEGKGGLCFHCYNCQASSGFGEFLKHVNSGIYHQYVLELIAYRHGEHAEHEPEDLSYLDKLDYGVAAQYHKPGFSLGLPTIASLSNINIGKIYVRKRHIPVEADTRLYFCADVKNWVEKKFPEKLEKYGNIDARTPGLVIPFLSKSGDMDALQIRLLSSSSLRYITFKFAASKMVLFGVGRLDVSKRVYIVEGPIDSLFLPNCVAAANSNLSAAYNELCDCFPDVPIKASLVFDNERRNPQIIRLMQRAIKKDLSLVIWPDTVKEKDINDMALAGIPYKNIIAQCRFSGAKAQMRLMAWKRC